MKSDVIGETAGKVWKQLGERGPSSMRTLARKVGTDSTTAQLAVGWLAREGKVTLERKGTQLMVSLTDDETGAYRSSPR